MIDLSGDYIKHLPKQQIMLGDECCLGYDNCRDYRLVFEEWEFRIYNYEYWSYDSIVDWEHEEEDWWGDCNDYFKGGDWCLDLNSCEYMSLKFENNNPVWMAYEIWEACDALENRYLISDWNDEWPNDKLVNFIKEHLMGVYCYYK